MPEYEVSIDVAGYVWVTVEADDEDDARHQVESNWRELIDKDDVEIERATLVDLDEVKS